MKHQIEFDGVWKRYNLRRRKGWRIRYALRDWTEGVRARAASRPVRSEFWAAKDVTWRISHGDSWGIIGDNGAGKSTLLKLIAGVTYPTRGTVRVLGRVGALVDVGAGMHPDLTGSENIFLYGTILGLSRKEIRRRFDDIVGFSEFSEFLDVPLKRYSAGMKIRLGFAVASFLDPDILLIDEVLAVGDVAFQRKCVDRIHMLQRGGTTIVFVSHDLAAVERTCERVAWMKEGEIHESGDSAEVINHYRAFVDQRFAEAARRSVTGNDVIEVERVVLADPDLGERVEFSPREDIQVNVHLRSSVRADRPAIEFHLKVVDPIGRTLILTSSGPRALPLLEAHGMIQCRITGIPFAPGTYQIWGQVVQLSSQTEVIPWQPMAAFSVVSTDASGSRPLIALHQEDRPILDVPTYWSVDGQFPVTERPAARRT